MKDPQEPRVLCVAIIQADPPEHIRRDLLICPQSFQINDAIDESDGIGGRIVAFTYCKSSEDEWGFNEANIRKLSALPKLLGIFVLCQLTCDLRFVRTVFESVVPNERHTPEAAFIEEHRSRTWALRALRDLADLGVTHSPIADHSSQFTIPIAAERSRIIQATSLHLFNYRSLQHWWTVYLVHFGPSSHLSLVLDITRLNYSHDVVMEAIRQEIFAGWSQQLPPPPNHDERMAVPVFDFPTSTFDYLVSYPGA